MLNCCLCQVEDEVDEMAQPRALSNYKYLLILAQLLHGAGATPIYTLAVTYLDENLKAKMTPMYVGESSIRPSFHGLSARRCPMSPHFLTR